MATYYGEDLAYIHDVGFSFWARGAAPGLLQLLARGGITQGRVVDLGCGSGVWAAQLLRAGYEVLGVDRSPAMLSIARRRAPRATFCRGSFLDVTLPACAGVTSIGECFNYRFDEQAGERPLGRLFQRVFAALQPGGLFMFDVAEAGRATAAGGSPRAWSARDWALLVEVQEDPARRELTRRMTIFRKQGRHYRRSEEVHRLRLFHGPDLARRLRQVGFRVRIVRGYGDFRFPRGVVGLLARKPG